MVLNPSEVRWQVQRFVDELSRHIRVDRAVLFGSYAYGTPHEGSDVDLAIVSPDFAKMARLERLEFLEEIAWKAQTHQIEPVGFTNEELASAGIMSVLSEIRDRGMIVDLSGTALKSLAVREDRTDYRAGDDKEQN
jgi:predicted nucleotidyltransferase